MYHDVDRPSATRMALTFMGIVAAIVLVIAASSFALGSLGKSDTPAAVVSPPPTSSAASTVAPTTTASPSATSSASGSLSSASAKPKAVPSAKPVAPANPVPPTTQIVSSGVVVIDAGHQARADTSLEPIGPGSTEKKPKVAGGATGVVAPRVPESEINLAVALKLRSALEAGGVKVIMVRTSQDVNIANSERAAVANEAGAALFVRLHCDGIDNSTTHGLSTLVPARNQWTGPILAKSSKAGKLVHEAVIAATGATDRGIVGRSDMSGFNWSKVPTVLVEMGFMSNSAEDRLLNTPSYQQKLAEGLARGIEEYLRTQ